jgi:hypothetical protein
MGINSSGLLDQLGQYRPEIFCTSLVKDIIECVTVPGRLEAMIAADLECRPSTLHVLSPPTRG